MMNFFKIFILSLTLLIPHAHAQDVAQETLTPDIQITEAYAFATAPGGITGASFMVFRNEGTAEDTLIKAQSDVAEITEIHENLIDPDDGKMMMRKIKGITVKPSAVQTLEPKGKHIMLIKLKEPLTLGQSFPLTLTFEKSGVKTVDVEIIQPGSSPKGTVQINPAEPHAHHHSHEDSTEKNTKHF